MEATDAALEELRVAEEAHNKGTTVRGGTSRVPEKEYKSKNLEAERTRRGKLSGRLLKLRTLVPIITNMTKQAIVEDSITYIRELQKLVRDLSDQLDETEESSCVDDALPKLEPIEAAEEMKKNGIEEDVKLAHIGENKMWVKMILQKKKGGLTRLMEAIRALGFELTDISVTTHQGAILVSSLVEGICGAKIAHQNTRELLLQTIRGI